jgi:hypothetical protein
MSHDSTTQPTTIAPSAPRSRGPSAGRTAAVVAGSLIGLVAVALLIGGGALLWGNSQKDDDGYVSTARHGLHTSAYALTTDNLDIDLDGAGWVLDTDHLGHVRVQATSRNDKPVFVGIAPTRDVSAYLAKTAHSSVADIEDGPFSSFHVTYRDHGGDVQPVAPAQQRFWAASAQGTGAPAMTWKVRDGDYSIVIMNADGSAGVDAGVRAGADVPFLATAGWITLGGGLVLLAAAGGLLYLGIRKPPRSGAERVRGRIDERGPVVASV